MIKNYLLVTFRSLLKNKVFTIINILGLGIGLSVCIVAFFNHMFDYEFDRTHENFSKIYRINSFRDMEGREQEYGNVPATLGLEIVNDIPGIEKSARFLRSGSPVKRGEDIFETSISYVDPAFLDVFTFSILLGDKKSIDNQANILVSRSMATTLFGNDYPIGKSISIVISNDKEFSYTVGAVFEDFPENSSFRLNILTHFDNYKLMWNRNDADWKMWTDALFVMVPDKELVPSITQSLKNYIPVQNRAREDFRINRFVLIPLKEVGRNSQEIWSSRLNSSLHPAAVVSPPIMAIFILLIACFNFANTSRAIFSKRLKEIGLRKTFGGVKRQLVSQFMIESFIICLLALIAGLIMAEFLVPAYSSLWAYMTLELSLTKYAFFWIFLLLLLLITGFLAGVYPALYVSSFNPVVILKGSASYKGSGRLSIILLTMQFSISIMALMMGIVFARNADYQQTLDRGYDKDQLIIVPVSPEYFSSFRDEALSNPKVISAEGTQNHIGFGSYRRPVKDEAKQLEVDVMDVGPEYASVMGLRLVEGRLFDELRTDADRSNNSIIVNTKWVEAFGWKDAVGRSVTMYDTTKYTVIGVVENYYSNGIWSAIEPAMMKLSVSNRYGGLVVKGRADDLPEILEYLNVAWKNLNTNNTFNGMLQEDIMQEEKDINGSIMKVNIFLAIAATLLSLIGMYNLVSLDIIKRTKEMGIRKILGAPVPFLMFLVSLKFLIVLAVASILGCLGGYYMSIMLLDSIWDYFVDISFGFMVMAVVIMFGATIITIVFKIWRAAMRNPVVSLRYE